MFGLYMVLLNIAARIGLEVHTKREELKRRKRSRELGHDVWVDRYGTAHHVSDDKPFMIVNDYENDRKIEINPYTREVIRDVSKEYRQKETEELIKQAKANGENLYPMTKHASDDYSGYSSSKCPDGKKNAKGRRWVDMNTGKLYVKRTVNCYEPWFIDLQTGLFAFPTNNWASTKTEEEITQKREKLNEFQKKTIQEYGLESAAVWRNKNICHI